MQLITLNPVINNPQWIPTVYILDGKNRSHSQEFKPGIGYEMVDEMAKAYLTHKTIAQYSQDDISKLVISGQAYKVKIDCAACIGSTKRIEYSTFVEVKV